MTVSMLFSMVVSKSSKSALFSLALPSIKGISHSNTFKVSSTALIEPALQFKDILCRVLISALISAESVRSCWLMSRSLFCVCRNNAMVLSNSDGDCELSWVSLDSSAISNTLSPARLSYVKSASIVSKDPPDPLCLALKVAMRGCSCF